MAKFQIFYDYECPFCRKGYEDLMDLLPAYSIGEIEWRPIEAHPRPENAWPHTDLCVEAYYTALELGADMDAFKRIMFRVAATERQNVEKGEVLAQALKGILDSGKFLEILKNKKYAFKVNENNSLAYDVMDVWYVPAFRFSANNSKDILRLDARGGIGVSRKEIKNFLDKLNVL